MKLSRRSHADFALLKDAVEVQTVKLTALEAAVAIDIRNLDIAWIILCSESRVPKLPQSTSLSQNVRVRLGLAQATFFG